MSNSGGGPSSTTILLDGFDASVSPISAADMLNRSLRRTPRRTGTPARRLFPDNIDIVAPGMTPTSRSQPKRKSAAGVRIPQKSSRSSRIANRSALQQLNQTLSEDVFDEGTRSTSSRLGYDGNVATPIAAQGNESILESNTSIIKGKRKARDIEMDESNSIVASFGAWGGGREESPMELLRRLVKAPGRLQSPIENSDDTMQSISQRLQGNVTKKSLRTSLPPGVNASEDMTREMPPPNSRPSSSSGSKLGRMTASRFSMANTSMAASEVGQGRRAARQSQVANMFSDLLRRDNSEDMSIGQTTGGKGSEFLLPEGISKSQEEASMDRDDQIAEDDQNRREDSSTFEDMMDLTAPASVKRFEDIDATVDSTRSQLFNEEYSTDGGDIGDEGDRDESDVFKTRNRLARSSDDEASQMIDERDAFDFGNDDEMAPSEAAVESFKQSDAEIIEPGYDMTESSDEGEDDDLVDQSKELQAARLNLLRKRRSKKKAKRYSSITGNVVPSLSSSTIKADFVSSIMPKTGLGLRQNINGKTTIEKGALEAVEDLTHHFFAQFMQSLVAQADDKSLSSISERDILSLLKSQGKISKRNSVSFLARKYLPKELSDLVTSTTAVNDTASTRRRLPKRPVKSLEDSRVKEEIEEDDTE